MWFKCQTADSTTAAASSEALVLGPERLPPLWLSQSKVRVGRSVALLDKEKGDQNHPNLCFLVLTEPEPRLL